jgi:AraC family transcriptional regulator
MTSIVEWHDGCNRYYEGNGTLKFSSHGLGWEGIGIAQYSTNPSEHGAIENPFFLLTTHLGATPTSVFHRISNFSEKKLTKPPRNLHLFEPGLLPSFRHPSRTSIFLCGLGRSLVEEVAIEMRDDREAIESVSEQRLSHNQFFTDPSTQQILGLLGREVVQQEHIGSLYATHLSYALAARLVYGLRTYTPRERRYSSKLPGASLRRVLERIQHDPNQSLGDLAQEAGVSKRHFLRMFKESMRVTPHQYIIQFRLQQASKLLQDRSLSILDIALMSGFTDGAHFSRTFQKHFGRSPGLAREDL